MSLNIYQKLVNVQNELKAPKSQRNTFGNYNYRNCEDILEAAKPLCKKHGLLLSLDDRILNIGDRFYVVATASVVNIDKPEEKFLVEASAREEAVKKGMDGSQVTGASSSYARKYALNGLFLIDDTKDADTKKPEDNETLHYTQEQKNRFDKYVKDKDALRLYLFTKSIEESDYNSLYNSFPDGKKVAMKKECSELEKEGSAIAREIVETVTEQVKNNDPAYVENLEGLMDDEKKVLASMFNKDTLDKIKEMRKGEGK